MSERPKYVICEQEGHTCLSAGVVYEVEHETPGTYALAGEYGTHDKSWFDTVDLDAPHDYEPGDTVRVVVGDEEGWSMFLSSDESLIPGSLNVGDCERVIEVSGPNQIAGNINIGEYGAYIHPAFVERVDADDTPTDAQRDHDRYTRTILYAQSDMVAALDAGRHRDAADGVCDDLRYAYKVAAFTRSGTERSSGAWRRRRMWASR